MRTTTLACCLLAATCSLAAQENDRTSPKTKVTEAADAVQAPIHYYRLNFVIEELGADGKPTNSRNYSMVESTDRKEPLGIIRTGSRIPVITGAVRGQPGSDKLDYQYQYVDVGVNIDSRNLHEIGSELAINLSAEISRLADAQSTPVSGLQTDPVIRQNSWSASVIIPVGKSTVVFTSDALDSKGGMQLLVTATPVQ